MTQRFTIFMTFVFFVKDVSVVLISHQVMCEACTALSVSADSLLCVEV